MADCQLCASEGAAKKDPLSAPKDGAGLPPVWGEVFMGLRPTRALMKME
jgi:hypothetical protein